jgi:2-phospho-L-lactate guanylyltransferase
MARLSSCPGSQAPVRQEFCFPFGEYAETMTFLTHPELPFLMQIQAIIPFKPVNPKTRLSCMLTQQERERFARDMLEDVIAAVIAAGCNPCILSTHPFEHTGARTVVSGMGLNEALNTCLASMNGPVLIIMADLPLATGEAVSAMISTGADCAIVPGRGGGTNAIFVRDPKRFSVDFYGASFLDHLAIARRNDLRVEVVDSFRLHTDIDEKEDLVEILLHGAGKARQYLEDAGFSLSLEKGRVGIQRDPHEEAL